MKPKQYTVTFAKGAPQEVTYPIEAVSKKEAKEEFSRQYIGRKDSTLQSLLRVMEWKEDEY